MPPSSPALNDLNVHWWGTRFRRRPLVHLASLHQHVLSFHHFSHHHHYLHHHQMNLLGCSSQSRFLLLCFRMHLDDTCLCIGDHSSYKGSQASCTCESICRKATLVQPEVLVVQPSSQCLGLGHHRIQCLGSNLFLPEGGCQDRLQDSVSKRRLDSLLSDSVFVGSLHKVAVD